MNLLFYRYFGYLPLLGFLATFCLFVRVHPLGAQDTEALERGLFQQDESVPWEIVADEVSYDDRTETYIAAGNVEIFQQDRRLSADYVRFNHLTFEARARGHVVLRAGPDLLIGEEMELNLRTQTGRVIDGTIFLSDNHFYIQGDRIEKLGPDAYEVERATVTSCDGETPDWKITGRRINITVEGYGVIRHAAVWARRVPLAYAPVMVFPAKRKRQTGLLFPEFGESDRKGTEYLQPFFWAINEPSDATFYEHYMSQRGHKVGAEYRYLLDESSRGTVMFDYLEDRQVDDGVDDNSDRWGYTGDNFLRTNSDRYWFRMKHDQALPYGFSGRLDLDLVSDQDYLTEFRRGMTGFDASQEYFENAFGRELEDYTERVRTNSLVLSRYWQRFSVNAGSVWNDDPAARQNQPIVGRPGVSMDDTSLHRLPFVEFDAIRQPVGATPLFWNMQNEYSYFYSDDNSRAHRVDLHPRVSWPFRLLTALSVEPSAGLRQTAWWVDEYQDNVAGESDKAKEEYRTLYDLKLDTSTELGRVFRLEGEGMDALRHTLRPRVVYEFIPDEDQDDLPAFFSVDENGRARALRDGVNRIDRKHLVTYSLVQNLTARYRRTSGDDDDPAIGYAYRSLGRLELSQSYDIFEAGEDDPLKRRDRGEGRKPFLPVTADLELYPTRNLTFTGETSWDPYDNRFVTRDAAVSWSSRRGDWVRAEYHYDETDVNDIIESAIGSLSVRLPHRLTLYLSHEHDLERDERIESMLGVIYESQCWAVDFRYTREEDDQAVAFMVRLVGLGELGNI